MFKINYKIKYQDIRNLELVSQTDGYLQVLRMNSDWASLLESKARIAEAVSSIGVEGTVVTLDQAKAITVGNKNIQIGEKEKREFVGYYESLQYIKKNINEELTNNFLLRIHEMITRGDRNSYPGKFRVDQRGVQGKKGKLIYKAPPPDHLSFLIREFIKWFNKVSKDKNFSPVIAAAICHFWFVWIHPFCDGNGRVSRLLTTFLLLKKKSEGIRYFALSGYYNKNKDSYYDTLEVTNICDPSIPSMNFDKDLTPWISYFIKSYLFQMKEIKEVTNRILQLNIRVDHLRRQGLITENHNKVLSLLSTREKVSYGELQEYLDISKPRVHQILEPLRRAHILIEDKIGSTMWFKLGAPDDEPDETILIKKRLNKKSKKLKKPLDLKLAKQGTLPIFE